MLLANHSQPFFSLIRDSWRFYRAIFLKTIFITVLLEIITFAITLLNVYVMLLGPLLGAILYAVISGVLASYPYSAFLIRSYGIISNDNERITNTWQIAKQKYLPATAYMVIYNLLMQMCLLLTESTYLSFVGYLLMVFLSVAFALGIPLIVLRNEMTFAAFKKSFSLVWGNWWRTFGVFLCIGIPAVIAIGIIFFMVFLSIGPHFLIMNLFLLIFAVIFLLLLPFFILPLCLSTLLAVFNDLELRAKESGELRAENPQQNQE